jgi:hypothetical protein
MSRMSRAPSAMSRMSSAVVTGVTAKYRRCRGRLSRMSRPRIVEIPGNRPAVLAKFHWPESHDPCHPGRSEAESRDARPQQPQPPDAASAASRGTGGDKRNPHPSPGQSLRDFRELRRELRPVPALRFASAGMTSSRAATCDLSPPSPASASATPRSAAPPPADRSPCRCRWPSAGSPRRTAAPAGRSSSRSSRSRRRCRAGC